MTFLSVGGSSGVAARGLLCERQRLPPTMLGNSFLQKVIISAVAGAGLACLVWFYRNVVDAGDRALNQKYRKAEAPLAVPNYSQPAAPRRP